MSYFLFHLTVIFFVSSYCVLVLSELKERSIYPPLLSMFISKFFLKVFVRYDSVDALLVWSLIFTFVSDILLLLVTALILSCFDSDTIHSDALYPVTYLKIVINRYLIWFDLIARPKGGWAPRKADSVDDFDSYYFDVILIVILI